MTSFFPKLFFIFDPLKLFFHRQFWQFFRPPHSFYFSLSVTHKNWFQCSVLPLIIIKIRTGISLLNLILMITIFENFNLFVEIDHVIMKIFLNLCAIFPLLFGLGTFLNRQLMPNSMNDYTNLSSLIIF